MPNHETLVCYYTEVGTDEFGIVSASGKSSVDTIKLSFVEKIHSLIDGLITITNLGKLMPIT